LRRARAGIAAAALALAAAEGPAAAAEVRTVEAVGAVPLDASAPAATAPRDAALHLALQDAVRRTAFEELDRTDPAQQSAAEQALGDDPLAYATRFRIVEDRGARPALFSDTPGVETEYVVVVEVYVDVDRVRDALGRRGLAVRRAGGADRVALRVVLEDLDGYPTYAAVRALLAKVGARSALPVELERGRAVLEVDSDRGPEALADALVRAAPPNLSLSPLSASGQTLRLRAQLRPGDAAAGAPAD
jgi:hypothetical protein